MAKDKCEDCVGGVVGDNLECATCNGTGVNQSVSDVEDEEVVEGDEQEE